MRSKRYDDTAAAAETAVGKISAQTFLQRTFPLNRIDTVIHGNLSEYAAYSIRRSFLRYQQACFLILNKVGVFGEKFLQYRVKKP
jgi:hypothetical protein